MKCSETQQTLSARGYWSSAAEGFTAPANVSSKGHKEVKTYDSTSVITVLLGDIFVVVGGVKTLRNTGLAYTKYPTGAPEQKYSECAGCVTSLILTMN